MYKLYNINHKIEKKVNGKIIKKKQIIIYKDK